MLTEIRLGGFLGQRFGREWRLDLDVPSPSEAVRALSAVCKGFRAFVLEHSAPGYHVILGEREDIAAEDLGKPTGRQSITIMPALAGAKSGWLNVILGAVLIAGGIGLLLVPGGQGFGAHLLATGSSLLLGLGTSLAIGGVSQLLAGAPPPADKEKNPANDPNYVFTGPVNTTGIGHPVPILYGQLEIGSQVISAGISRHSVSDNGGSFGGDTEGPGGEPPIGHCPAPWVPILLADGRELAAGSIRAGMRVRTQHEHTLEWGEFEVEAVSFHEERRWRLMLKDGREFVGSAPHRVRTEEGWIQLDDLQPGDSLVGAVPGVVLFTEPEHVGPVVRITVKDAHTFISAGFLSHNWKQSPPIGST
jgi:predicted phage tail protein